MDNAMKKLPENQFLEFMDFFTVCRPGMYTVDEDVLKESLKEFLLYGTMDTLGDYETILYATWDINNYSPHTIYYSEEKIKTIEQIIAKYRSCFNNFFSDDDLCRVQGLIESMKLQIDERNSYPGIRKTANTAISKKGLREKVFEKSGHLCEICLSTDDLTIDHIISVKKGGQNDIDNLRVLCRTCNSSKGAL